MPEGSVVFSKIAATPKETAWSQAYSAGKLFTVLSLKKEASGEETGENSLKAIGKNILDALETEFFSLEEKNLESVKASIAEASNAVPQDIELSFVTTVVSGNILYSYIVGKGEIFIKRGDKFGYVLESKEDTTDIASASGFLQNGDLIILATEGFTKAVSKDQLLESLDNLPPSEIAENLAPTIHESDEAGAAAIILSYKEDMEAGAGAPEEEEKEEINTVSRDETIEKVNEEHEKEKMNPLGFIAPVFSVFGKLIPKRLNHSKKIYLTIVAAVLLVLVASVILGIKRQNDAKIAAAFNAVYPQAEKKYEEGVSLKDLNKNLAIDSFTQSKKILEENKDKFPYDSDEAEQINALLEKVNKELADNSPSQGTENLDKSKITIIVQNGSGAEGAAGTVSDFLEEKGYEVSSTANADNYNYEDVTIRVKKSVENYLETLKKDLGEKYTVGDTSTDLPETSPSDVVVIIGK